MTNPIPYAEQDCYMRDRCMTFFRAAIAEGANPEEREYHCPGKDKCENYKSRADYVREWRKESDVY